MTGLGSFADAVFKHFVEKADRQDLGASRTSEQRETKESVSIGEGVSSGARVQKDLRWCTFGLNGVNDDIVMEDRVALWQLEVEGVGIGNEGDRSTLFSSGIGSSRDI